MKNPPDSVRMKKAIPILFEDRYLIAFNKPANLLVIPSPNNHNQTLVDIVNEQYPTQENSGKLHPCHRLDKETSGVILFAKGKKNQAVMMKLFQDQLMEKSGYWANIRGCRIKAANFL